MRFSHVSWHGVKVSDHQNEEVGSKGGGPFPTYWDMSLIYIQFFQVNKVISVEGCFMVTPDYERLHSW